MTCTIAVTSSRAHFSHLYWPLREFAARRLKLRDRIVDKLKAQSFFLLERRGPLTALGPRLSPEFGLTGGFAMEDLRPLVCR